MNGQNNQSNRPLTVNNQNIVKSLELKAFQETLKNYYYQAKDNKLVKQIFQVIQDISECLPENIAYGDLLQLLEKKMLTLILYVEELGELNDKGRMMHVLQLLNTFLNAIISGSNVLLDIRLFCLGDSPIPLPVYKIRNRIMKNAASPFMMFESAPGSGKTLMISAFISQLPQVVQDKKRLYITQSTDMKVQQTAKALRNILGKQQTISTKLEKKSHTKTEKKSNICVCTPIELIQYIHNNPEVLQGGMFILDDFQTRTVVLDVLFAKVLHFMIQQMKMNKYFCPYQFTILADHFDNGIYQFVTSGQESNLIIQVENKSIFNIDELHSDSQNLHQSTVDIPCELMVEFIQSIQRGEKQKGNILCFSSGQSECNQICETLIQIFKEDENITCLDFAQFKNMNAPDTYAKIKELMENKKSLFVVPISVYGQTPESDNSILFAAVPDDIKDRFMKVVVGSNMDESCQFVDDVILVVDSGIVQEFSWDEEKKMNIVQEKKVNDSIRNFRKNLAARTRVGYACVIENQELEEQQPEIERLDLKQAILALRESQINLETITQTLPSQPDNTQIKNALQLLFDLRAISNEGVITDFGKRLLNYKNIDPMIGCVFDDMLMMHDQINTIIGLIAYYLTVNNTIFVVDNFSKCLNQCFTEESDAATLVKCFLSVEKQKIDVRNQYCKDNGLNITVYEEVRVKVTNVLNTLSNSHEEQNVEYYDKIFEKLLEINETQILNALDMYVDFTSKLLKRIDLTKESAFHFQGISNLVEVPVYNYISNQSPVILQQRPGCTSVVAYSDVFFFEIQYGKISGVQKSKFMHRVKNSYKCSYSVSVPQNAIMLPFTKMLIQQYFTGDQAYNFIKKMNLRTISEETEFLAESLDKKQLFYIVDRNISQNSVDNMKQVVEKLVQISAVCPTTLISRYPGLPDYYVEFFQTDNKSDARFIQKQANNENVAPFAYSLNQKSVQLLVHSKVEFKISYVFDLKMNHATFREYGYSHDFNYSGDHVSRSRNGNVVNQLIIIADKKIQELPQLKWVGQLDERQVPLQYVLKDKSAETQSSQAAGNQGQYLPFNIASKDLQKHPQIIQDIKELVREMNINNVDFTQNGFTGNANNIQRIIHEVNSGFPLNLSLKEIRYYNIPRVQIESIVSSYVDAQIIFGKNNSIVVHSSLYEEINNKVLDLLDNNQDNLISFMSCGNDVCLPNTTSIASIVGKELKYQFYCEDCIQQMLIKQLQVGEMQIKIGSGIENFGKFVSFFLQSRKLRETATNLLLRTGELKAHFNKDFKFCNRCNQVGIKCGTPGIDQLLYSCNRCNHKWCSECGEWHKSGEKCVNIGNHKRCPNCKIYFEKLDKTTCNHIECVCGAHWCYICGKQFEYMEIYPHMHKAHGGTHTEE
ncbi:Ankyrin_repeat protein 3 [Hexamita inflata]|uniref:Ankyrin repeat protein 3 n=1 Tax=Hexamita inflata TaxID=28002 RepID=A0AA86QIY9_9EUKA|nr:Ankyrin repeat protein 3 [Hexamita inflata]